jgi:hypothetical protein
MPQQSWPAIKADMQANPQGPVIIGLCWITALALIIASGTWWLLIVWALAAILLLAW